MGHRGGRPARRRRLQDHPDLELVGALVYSDAKAGRDVGEICGIGDIGVTATTDPDEIIALDADCVLYMPQGEMNPMGALDDICRLLASGKNAVSTAVTCLIYPRSLGGRIVERLDTACAEGQTSFHATGIEPGWAAEVLPLTMSGLFQRIYSLLVQELMDYGTYDSADMLFDIMGFGKPPDEPVPMADAALAGVTFRAPLMLLADGLGATIDDFVYHREVAVADEAFDIEAGTGVSPAIRLHRDRRRQASTFRRAHLPARRRTGAGLADGSRMEGNRRGPTLDGARVQDRHQRRGRNRSGLPWHRDARRARDRPGVCGGAGNPYVP